MSAAETPSNTAQGRFERLVRTFNHAKRSDDRSRSPAKASKTGIAFLDKLKAILLGRKKKEEKIPFPPPSWFEDGHVVNPGASEAAAVPLPPSPEGTEDKDLPKDSHGDGTGDEGGGVGDAPPPPASWIARKVQELIDAFPLSTTPSSSEPPPDGSSEPPQTPHPQIDSKLANLLATAYIMNGSISKGRKSVWAALERLGSPPHGLHARKPEEGADGEADEPEECSLMLYSPLMPTSNDLVEVASSHVEIVPFEALNEDAEAGGVVANKWPWPFDKWGPKPGSGTTPPEGPKDPKPKEVRVWEPSLTKLSVKVMWWGYRLYLPPPLLAILGDKTLEASKRAIIITTALKWLVDHIPVKLVPLPLQPAVLILQTIVPFVGYIGAFIAWSWSAIKDFDKGNGVTLTATWLLPVALIPGTWEIEDVPKHKSPADDGKTAPPDGEKAPPAGGGKCPPDVPASPAPERGTPSGNGKAPPASDGQTPPNPPVGIPSTPPVVPGTGDGSPPVVTKKGFFR